MLQSNYTCYVFNCIQEEQIKDHEYLNLFHKIIGMLVRKEYSVIEIRHKNIVLMTFFSNQTISVKFSDKLLNECEYSTLLNAYISTLIRNANKQIINNKKIIKKYEENSNGSDGDIDTNIFVVGTDCVKGK